MADKKVENDDYFFRELGLQPYNFNKGLRSGITPKGNPIHDHGYHIFSQNLTKTKSLESIKEAIFKDLVKTDFIDKADEISKDLQKYILSKKEYHLNEVMMLLKKYITEDTLLLSEGKAISSV